MFKEILAGFDTHGFKFLLELSVFNRIDQDSLLAIRGNGGEKQGKRGIFDMTHKWESLNSTQRETYKLASAEDSDVPP